MDEDSKNKSQNQANYSKYINLPPTSNHQKSQSISFVQQEDTLRTQRLLDSFLGSSQRSSALNLSGDHHIDDINNIKVPFHGIDTPTQDVANTGGQQQQLAPVAQSKYSSNIFGKKSNDLPRKSKRVTESEIDQQQQQPMRQYGKNLFSGVGAKKSTRIVDDGQQLIKVIRKSENIQDAFSQIIQKQNGGQSVDRSEEVVHRMIDNSVIEQVRDALLVGALKTNFKIIIQEILQQEQLLKQCATKIMDQVLSDEMIGIITDCYTEALEDQERLTMTEQQHQLGLNSTCNFGTPNIKAFELTTRLDGAKQVKEWQEQSASQNEEDEDSVEDSSLFPQTHINETGKFEDEANAVFSSDDGFSDDDSESIKMNAAITPRKTALYLQKGFKSQNQIKKMGVMQFDQVLTKQSKLNFDESPFVCLTANPQYLDVLCVNCYECVRLVEVDSHSIVCKGIADQQRADSPQSNGGFNNNNREDSLIVMEKDISLVNEKLDKLTLALRTRLVEIEVEDSMIYGLLDKPMADPETIRVENETLSDRYSCIYAYAVKVLGNNDDPNQLLIMQRMVEDFLKESETQFKKKGYRFERIVGLNVFTRRLSHLNDEKFQILLRRFQPDNDRFDTLDKEEWSKIQQDMLKTTKLHEKKRSQQILNEIRSEISSEKYESQSDAYSEYSGITANYKYGMSSDRSHYNLQQPATKPDYYGDQYQAAANLFLGSDSKMRQSRHSYQTSLQVSSSVNGKPPLTNYSSERKGNIFADRLSPFRPNNINRDQQMSRSSIKQESNSRITQGYNKVFQQKSRKTSNREEPQSPTFTSVTGGAYSGVKADISSNLKKHFDSLVIEQLGFLKMTKMPQGFSFGQLYKQSEAEDINIDDWESFIQSQLLKYQN